MNEVLSGGLRLNDGGDGNKKGYYNDDEDVLFTKSAKELFDMKYIPIKRAITMYHQAINKHTSK